MRCCGRQRPGTGAKSLARGARICASAAFRSNPSVASRIAGAITAARRIVPYRVKEHPGRGCKWRRLLEIKKEVGAADDGGGIAGSDFYAPEQVALGAEMDRTLAEGHSVATRSAELGPAGVSEGGAQDGGQA